MGMFDYVDDGYEPLTLKCHKCGAAVTGFQTKDLNCQLERVQWRDCEYFITQCDECKQWLDCKVTVWGGKRRIVLFRDIWDPPEENEKELVLFEEDLVSRDTLCPAWVEGGYNVVLTDGPGLGPTIDVSKASDACRMDGCDGLAIGNGIYCIRHLDEFYD